MSFNNFAVSFQDFYFNTNNTKKKNKTKQRSHDIQDV